MNSNESIQNRKDMLKNRQNQEQSIKRWKEKQQGKEGFEISFLLSSFSLSSDIDEFKPERTTQFAFLQKGKLYQNVRALSKKVTLKKYQMANVNVKYYPKPQIIIYQNNKVSYYVKKSSESRVVKSFKNDESSLSGILSSIKNLSIKQSRMEQMIQNSVSDFSQLQ